MVGTDQVLIPGEGAAPVEMEAFWSRLGRPAKTDGYTVDMSLLAEHIH